MNQVSTSSTSQVSTDLTNMLLTSNLTTQAQSTNNSPVSTGSPQNQTNQSVTPSLAPQTNDLTGIAAIERWLAVLDRDRIWVKWGHGRFALIERQADGSYTVSPTKLSISPAEVANGAATAEERSRSRIFTGQCHDLEWLLELSKAEEPNGVFWIPAATAAELPLKADITVTDVISCEIDLCPKIEQMERFEWFRQVSGLEYGLQLSSGSKSIHVHIFLNTPVPFDEADRLRKLFILCLLGDPAIANRHQPMRAPGFFRQSKDNFQTLLSSSDHRYSLDEIEAGLKKVYADLDWAFPETLSDGLWGDCLKWLKERKDADKNVLPVVAGEQIDAIGALLKRGDRYYTEKRERRAKRADEQRIYRAQLELEGKTDLIGLIQGIDAGLTPDQAFNGADHEWTFSGSDHARGFCGWHAGSSNSAWLSKDAERGWTFHCPTCTNDKPVSGFGYWLNEKLGINAEFPTGAKWAELAKEYAALHGADDDDWDFSPATVERTSADKAAYFRSKNPEIYSMTGDRQIVTDRYVSEHMDLPEPGSLLGVSSDVSTGKTEGLKRLKAQFFERHPNGFFDMQGYRNVLLHQTATRTGGDHIQGEKFQRADPENVAVMLEHNQDLLYCLDSLERRLPYLMKALDDGKAVFVGYDEADSIAKHVLGGGTLGKRQATIFYKWVDLLHEVIKCGGYIGIFEADLPQATVDFYTSISNAKQVVLIENTYKPHEGRDIRFTVVECDREVDGEVIIVQSDALLGKVTLAELAAALIRGEKIFLATDAQGLGKRAEAIARVLGVPSIRIDSETGELAAVQAFMANPDEELSINDYQLAIVTTSAESGLSVSEGHFDRMFLYGSHLEDRALRQLASRVRGMIPIDAYVRSRGFGTSDDPDSFTADGCQKEIEKNAADSAAACDAAKEFVWFWDAAVERGNDAVAKALAHWQAVYMARKNISSVFLRENLKATYERTGHNVTMRPVRMDDIPNELLQLVKDAKASVELKETDEYCEAPIGDDLEAAYKTLSSPGSKYIKRVAAQKTVDAHRWPGLPFHAADFVLDEIIKGRRDGLKAHEFGWLCQNPKIAKLLDLKSWKKQLEQPFIVEKNVTRFSAKAQILVQSCLFQAAELEKYVEDDPLIVAIAEWAKARKALIARLFKLHIKDTQSNIAIVNKLLRRIGYKAKCIKQDYSTGERVRVWAAEPLPYQQEVWASLDEKYADVLAAETLDIGTPHRGTTTKYIEEKGLLENRGGGDNAPPGDVQKMTQLDELLSEISTKIDHTTPEGQAQLKKMFDGY